LNSNIPSLLSAGYEALLGKEDSLQNLAGTCTIKSLTLVAYPQITGWPSSSKHHRHDSALMTLRSGTQIVVAVAFTTFRGS
jgi:hypothetical protein